MFLYAFFLWFIMETHREQRMAITFCFKNELTTTGTFKMLQKMYGNEFLSLTNILEWYGKFCSGREDVGDDRKAGHTRTSQNISQKYTLLWRMVDVQ